MEVANRLYSGNEFVSISETIIFEVSKTEFDRVYKMVQSKIRGVQDNPENTFNIKIGNINMVFNKNNA